MEKNGWSFSWDDEHVFKSDQYYCRDVPSTSYCGFKYPGEGTISYTFSDTGKATLRWGQSWDDGSIHIKINNKEIDSRRSRGSSNTTFSFTSGDVLKIVDFNDAVINIHSLMLVKTGEKMVKGANIK